MLASIRSAVRCCKHRFSQACRMGQLLDASSDDVEYCITQGQQLYKIPNTVRSNHTRACAPASHMPDTRHPSLTHILQPEPATALLPAQAATSNGCTCCCTIPCMHPTEIKHNSSYSGRCMETYRCMIPAALQQDAVCPQTD